MTKPAADDVPAFAQHIRRLARGEPAIPELHRELVRIIPMPHTSMTIGSGAEADLILHDLGVSPVHALVECDQGKLFLRDLHSATGTFVNGQRITRELLEMGDLVHIGAYLFCFKDTHLVWLRQPQAPTLAALNLCRRAGDTVLLDDITLVLQPAEFIGLLGASGAGKTTLLDALHGYHPAESGRVFLDGEPLYEKYERLSHLLGYVPQADLVHAELTTRQALDFVCKLRLPQMNAEERGRLVDETLAVLDLFERANLAIGKLSGGQRKRVAVGVELLCKPGIIFLDEPTAGLDPGTEARLMRTLKQLTELGKTIVCTTHIMDNVDLFDRIAIMAAGGKLAFFGTPAEARKYFDIARPIELYDRLEEKSPADWQQQFRKSDEYKSVQALAAKERQPRPLAQQLQTQPAPAPSALAQWGTLTHRFARILCADFNTLGVALLQAVVMSNLICLVLREMPSIAFFLVVSALWFGCSGAAQQLVRERSIYHRERMVNLRLDAYLLSKFCLPGIIGAVQCVLMLAIVRCWKDDVVWPIMLPTLILASWNGVAIGLIISALAGSADKATSIVPLSLLPQIILAGVLTPIADMNTATSVASHAIAARWANQAMEVSLFEGKTINADLMKDEANLRPLWNLHPDYDLGSVEGRQKFLQENDGKTIRRSRWLGIDAAVLVGFVVMQLVAVAVILRRQDVF
jgi:ABC transport system ATP-binding/permease protein